MSDLAAWKPKARLGTDDKLNHNLLEWLNDFADAYSRSERAAAEAQGMDPDDVEVGEQGQRPKNTRYLQAFQISFTV